MGQYYVICNIDKQEYISPSSFGDGVKLMEFASCNYPGKSLSALAILLADGNNRGGGDLRSENPIVGSWKFDRIVVTGDYADSGIYDEVYSRNGEWKDISLDVWSAMLDDGYFAKSYATYLRNNYKSIVPSIFIKLAHAHKDKQYKNNQWANVALVAEKLFEKMFPEKDKDYYVTINGIAKHHPTYSGERLCDLNFQLEGSYILNEDVAKLENEIAELESKLDEKILELLKAKGQL